MYRIVSIKPRGSVPISLGPFTVVVGPNNAGKSQLLRDVGFCASAQNARAKVLEDVDVDLGPSAIDFLKARIQKMQPNAVGQYFLDGTGINLDEHSAIPYHKESVSNFTRSEEAAKAHIASQFARELIAYLTTESRLTFSKHRTNLHRPNSPGASSLVESLFYAGIAEERWIAERTRQAFGLEVSLDRFSNAGMLEVRVAPSFADLARWDQAQARQFMESCERLDEQGDGLRSFVASLGAAKTLHREVVLVDEPEAFLHPPQAFQIGKALGEGDFGGKQIVCATHSADFLRGVLSARMDVTVIRVARGSQGQSVKVLSPEELEKVANDPVLSSGRVLDGIFYRQVVITESDGDAVLYGHVSASKERAGETYYVNSYSKQATEAVAAPYKHMGVPHAVIVDIDLIRVGPEFSRVARAFLEEPSEAERLAAKVRSRVEATTVADLVVMTLQRTEALTVNLKQLSLPDPDKQLEWLRARLSDIRADASSWAEIKRRGIEATLLDCETKASLRRLIDVCGKGGLFLVPVGERESWLEPDVPYTKNKAYYTTQALQYLANQNLPVDGPLSSFMEAVHSYLESQ